MSDNDLIRRGDAVAVLRKAQIASCTCQAKTPDPEWHLEQCRYRILREAEAMIDHVTPHDTAPLIDAAVAQALEQAASLSGWWIGITPSGEPDGTYCSVSPHDDPHSEKYVRASRIRALRPAAQPAPDAAAIREAALLAAWTAVYEAKTLLDAKNAVHALLTEKPHDRA